MKESYDFMLLLIVIGVWIGNALLTRIIFLLERLKELLSYD